MPQTRAASKNRKNRHKDPRHVSMAGINLDNPYSLSVNLENKGHLLAPGAFGVASSMIDFLIDNMDGLLLHRKVEVFYKTYCARQVMLESLRGMTLAKIEPDQTDLDYDYDDECIEPRAAKIDACSSNITVKAPLMAPTSYLEITSKTKRKRSSKFGTPRSDRSMSRESNSRKMPVMRRQVTNSKASMLNINMAVNILGPIQQKMMRKMASMIDINNRDLLPSPNNKRNPVIYNLPEDPSKEERNREREAMQEKLDDFIKFKKQSRKIVREQSLIFDVEKKKEAESNLFSLLTGNDSDDSFDLQTGKVDYLKRARNKLNKKKEGKQKLTFDFKGKLLKVKQAVVKDDADQVIVTPEVRVQSNQRKFRIIDKATKPRADDMRKTLIDQFGDELDQIYEETELKAMIMQSQDDSFEEKKKSPKVAGKTVPILPSVVIKDTIREESEFNPLATQSNRAESRITINSETKWQTQMMGSHLKHMHNTTTSDNNVDEQKRFLTGKHNKGRRKSCENNIKEMGHAHIKHENRLFMKNPLQKIDKSTIGSGVVVRSNTDQILQEGPVYDTSSTGRLSITQYKSMKGDDFAMATGAFELPMNDAEKLNAARISIKEMVVPQNNKDISVMERNSVRDFNQLSTISRKDEENSHETTSQQALMIKDKSSVLLKDPKIYISTLNCNRSQQKQYESSSNVQHNILRKQGVHGRKMSQFVVPSKISFAADTKTPYAVLESERILRTSSLPKISGVTPRALSLLMDSDGQNKHMNHSFLPELNINSNKAWVAIAEKEGLNKTISSNSSRVSPLLNYMNSSKLMTKTPNQAMKASMFKSASRSIQANQRLFQTQNMNSEGIDNEYELTSVTPTKRLEPKHSSIFASNKMLQQSQSRLFDSAKSQFLATKQSDRLSAQLKERLQSNKLRNHHVSVTENALELLRHAKRSKMPDKGSNLSSLSIDSASVLQ